jgi:sigma-E factor negative regulatory protein RseA
MNEQEQISQLSALFDNELPADQVGLVIRRTLKDPGLRASWSRYAIIGASLRNEPMAVHGRAGDDLASRVSAALTAEAEFDGSEATARGSARSSSASSAFSRGAWGVAVAASVAAISLLVLREQSVNPVAAPTVLAQAQPASTTPAFTGPGLTGSQVMAATREPASRAALPSYTTPIDTSPAGQRLSAPLVNYVVAHSEVSTSAVRFSPLSTVMSDSYDPTQGTVEMTEAEIGARR